MLKPLLRGTLALLALATTAAHANAQDPAPRDTLRLDAASNGNTVRVCAGGDVTLGTNLDPSWAQSASRKYGMRVDPFPDPDSLLAPLRPLVADADVVLLNVEGAIGEGVPARRKCAPGSTACFAFRMPVATAAALRRVADADGAAVVGNVANNHAGDAGRPGWRRTARHLEDAGVRVTGADTVPTVVATARGDTVAFLGFSVWIGPDARDLAAVRRIVGRAAERWERVVVTVHMGAEGRAAQRTPDARETFYGENRGNPVAFARAAADAGADLVVGHGPHVMRAAEWRGATLVLYSLGNLLTYGPFNMGEPLNRGAVACAVLDPAGRVVEAQLRSTRQAPPGLLRADPAARAAALTDSLSRLDFPATGARVDPDGSIRLPGAPPAAGGARETARRPRPVRKGGGED